jgi:hypothetical protein
LLIVEVSTAAFSGLAGLQSSSFLFFSFLLFAQPTGPMYAHTGKSKQGHSEHPEIGVIYEHIFHLFFGHPLTYPQKQRLNDLTKVLDYGGGAASKRSGGGGGGGGGAQDHAMEMRCRKWYAPANYQFEEGPHVNGSSFV